MNPAARTQRGFVLIEALGAIFVLTLALGSLAMLMMVAANVKRHSVTQVQFRHLLNMHLQELRIEMGAVPDCSLTLEDMHEGHLPDRTYRFNRSIRTLSWEGSAPPPAMLLYAIDLIPDGRRQEYHESVSALFPCNRLEQ
jgi:Tfp pilus assembly protein PilV